LQLPLGQALAYTSHGNRPLTERELRRLGHHRTIHAAGIRNRATCVPAYERQQPIAFGGENFCLARHGETYARATSRIIAPQPLRDNRREAITARRLGRPSASLWRRW